MACCAQNERPQTRCVIINNSEATQARYIAEALVRSSGGSHAFQVKTLVKDPFSAKAQELAELGCMVMKGAFEKPKALWLAMKGCFAAICVVDPLWKSGKDSKTVNQCIEDYAKACAEFGVRQFVLCYTCDCREDRGHTSELQNKLSGLGFKSFHIMRYPSFCYEDFIHEFEFKRCEGKMAMLEVSVPRDSLISMVSAADAGKTVQEIVANPKSFCEKIVNVNPTVKKMKEFIEILEETADMKIRIKEAPTTSEPENLQSLLNANNGSKQTWNARTNRKGPAVATGRSFKSWAKDSSSKLSYYFQKCLENVEDNNVDEKNVNQNRRRALEQELMMQMRQLKCSMSAQTLQSAVRSITDMRVRARNSSPPAHKAKKKSFGNSGNFAVAEDLVSTSNDLPRGKNPLVQSSLEASQLSDINPERHHQQQISHKRPQPICVRGVAPLKCVQDLPSESSIRVTPIVS
mmetsp:Transcript_20850/g.29140  ORF Transcript_20850/g.29140 Transcript_20850/m.29140 type:complete len:462 (+) Transcript_20850:228-1613(+)|eukprot:CAMPEP_0184502990 /NCGR_PEP_ID=MMETSP0113_2-20130426/51610_1 /TAXON_ID=91329 /ORGANISM="Norrisiella sphaerica, Strain BC52" /LENGTH=461 /DNA_ID=CAMNT_0026892375 /DNA_START=759 /DNA_END=2144 /DNA_ORIENTATION=-